MSFPLPPEKGTFSNLTLCDRLCDVPTIHALRSHQKAHQSSMLRTLSLRYHSPICSSEGPIPACQYGASASRIESSLHPHAQNSRLPLIPSSVTLGHNDFSKLHPAASQPAAPSNKPPSPHAHSSSSTAACCSTSHPPHHLSEQPRP